MWQKMAIMISMNGDESDCHCKERGEREEVKGEPNQTYVAGAKDGAKRDDRVEERHVRSGVGCGGGEQLADRLAT